MKMASGKSSHLELQVEGLEHLKNTLEEHKGKPIFLMFTGAIDETGDSWCGDCKRGIKIFS